MPVYDYEHTGKGCKLGKVFEWEQSVKSDRLELCPQCGKKVKRLISMPNLSFPKTNGDLKRMGFSKLVRRDKGVYENVSAQDGENRIVELGNQKTYPNFKKRPLN